MDFANHHVLVLDDSHSFCRLVSATLSGLGVSTIVTFDDPEAAMAYMRSHAVDVAIVDGSHAKAPGCRFAAALRLDKQQRNRTVPLVLMSGAGDERLMQLAIDAGIDSVLPKPLRKDKLAQTLARLRDHPRVYIHARTGYCGPDRRRTTANDVHDNKRRGGDTFQVYTKKGPVSLDQLEQLQKAGQGKVDLEVLLVRGVKILAGYKLNAQEILAA